MNPGSITAWTRVGGRVTAPATAATMDVQYLLYMSSGWVNIDDVEVTAVTPPANYVTKYYYFNGQRVAMRVNGVLTYLHTDHLGSTVLETNSSGAIINDEKYRAFGKQRDTGIVGTDYQFTGQKQDASGLQYFNARFFDPLTGMFVSPDTMVPDPGLVFAYDRFMYVYGRVMNANDPSGHDPCAGVCPSGTDTWQQVVDLIQNGLNSPAGPYIASAAVAAPPVGLMTAVVVGGVYGVGETTWDLPDYPPVQPVVLPGGFTISIPEPGSTTVTSGVGISAPQDPGFTVVQPKASDNVVETNPGRSGKQQRLRDLVADDKVSSADRGWIQQDINAINAGNRTNIRVPPGTQLAHRRGYEARDGYGYEYADIQGVDLHRLQHKHEGYKRRQKAE